MGHFWTNLTYHNGMQSAITTKNHIQKLHLCRTLSIRNGELWCNESHPLLLNYLKTLLEYIYKMKGIYKVIYQPLWCHSTQVPSDSIAKDSQKYKILGVTLSLVNGRMGRKKSHPLLPKCCKTIIVCPYKTWDTSGLILHTTMGCKVPSQPRITFKSYIFAALSV